jgi:iron complex outermembrane receptor protein
MNKYLPHSFSRETVGATLIRQWSSLARAGRWTAACVVLSAFVFVSTYAAEQVAASLADLTLEQLGNIQITSVSRRPERLADAAASIYVITAEDIRRSGTRTLPEVLRLAPNLQVARADANQYAVSARGFNNVLANKMLVLMDGRTVYSPLFSGVFWEAQDVMLEDVERIEVISGPGGTLWGSNAVNGVINIITSPAAATQSALVSAGGGSKDSLGALRYGGEFGAGGHYRVYGKYSDMAHTSAANGTSVGDASARVQAGFRADWSGDAVQNYTIQGDAYEADIDQNLLARRRVSGFNVLGRLTRDLGNGGNLLAQTYYDRTERKQPGAIIETLDTLDIEIQHGLRPLARHNVLWGGGYRYSVDRVQNISPAALALLPPHRNLGLANIFVQDEIALHPDLALTVGLKAEHNNYTGLEYLPNVRLAWKPAGDRLVWGALSRAVRAPARIDRDLFVPGTPPFALAGGANFVSEVANVVELGYRAQHSAALSYSITAFQHNFDRLRSLEPAVGGLMFDNKVEGTNTGIEAWGNYRVNEKWRLAGGLVQQSVRFNVKPGGANVGGFGALGNDPSHWWTLRSSFDISPRVEFDLMARRIGALSNPAVPGYTAVDARLGWRVRPNLELSLTAQNLFDPRHAEWNTLVDVTRGFFAKLMWKL